MAVNRQSAFVYTYPPWTPQFDIAENVVRMKKAELLTDIVATYAKHGWQLQKILLTPVTTREIREVGASLPQVTEAPFDALWFSRPSRGDREAWELRLLEGTAYALFENFEPDETEEQREEMRREMEARLRDYLAGS